MDYTKLKIYTGQSALDLLANMLSDLGITGFEINDPAEFADFAATKSAAWDYIEDGLAETKKDAYVIAYVPKKDAPRLLPAVEALLAELRGIPGYGELLTEYEDVKEEDWAENWKQYYKPFEVGRFIVKPTWENLDSAAAAEKEEKIVLEIDPTGSFGTGQHETTKLCLLELTRLVQKGARVLDAGCGSGILSLGAALLGAANVTSVDVFENCAATTRENMRGAGFDDSCVYCGNIIEDDKLRSAIGGGFDLITANIVADVLIAMSPIFYDKLNLDGYVIMSGIITKRETEVVQAAQSAGLKLMARADMADWLCLTFVKQRVQ